MLQNLLSLNSTPPSPVNKSPAPSARADAQAGFGRALNDAGNTRYGKPSGTGDAGEKAPSDASASNTSATGGGDKLNNKPAGSGKADMDGSAGSNDTVASSELDTTTQSDFQPINGALLLKSVGGIGPAQVGNGDEGGEGKAVLSNLKSGLAALAGDADGAASTKTDAASGQQVPGANTLVGGLQFGTNGSAQTLAELAAGNVAGATAQAGIAGIKQEGRHLLDKSNNALPGLAQALEAGGKVEAVAKDLPRAELAGLRAAAADEKLQDAKLDSGAFKDNESLMLAGKGGADASAVKSVNELALGSLTSTSQTLVNAIKENSNWTKMLSAPTVNFSETMRPNGKVLQTLSVTLNPVELGKLELNLRMQQGQVTIDVRTESDQAYRTLLVDQDALVNTLRSLGFKVDGININGPQSENSTQFQNPGQSENQAAGEGTSGEASRGHESGDGDSIAHSSEGMTADEEDPASHNVI